MATIVLSNLAHISDFEADFFDELIRSFRDLGHRVFFWSAVEKQVLNDSIFPMRWRISELSRFYPIDEIDPSPTLEAIDQEKWQARLDVLAKQDPRSFPRGRDLEILAAVTQHVFDTLSPDLFLAWNPLCPHFGVAHDLCASRGIPSLLIERAFFPDTWFVEKGGLVGHSRLCGMSMEEMLSGMDREEMKQVGRDYLASSPFGTMDRYAQNRESAIAERLVSGDLSEARPRIAVFPPDDLSLGFFPVDHEDRRRHLPGFENSFEAARALAEANRLGTTVFKPHPSFLEWKFDAPESGLVSLNHSYNTLIDWADIVATTGSGLAFTALAEGKPVISLGRDALTGKGITYEAFEPEKLSGAIADANSREGFAAKKIDFEAFTGYALSEAVVSHPGASRSYLRPGIIAERVHEEFFSGTANRYGVGGEAQILAEMCGVEWVEPEETNTQESVSSGPVLPASITELDISADLDSMTSQIREDPGSQIVLDFDYTLLLSNSTELYLDSIRPRWAGYLLSKIVKGLHLERLCRSPEVGAGLYDQVRVFLATVLFPWTFFLWKGKAEGIADAFANRRLISAVKSGNQEEVIVISNGFSFLIRPLLNAIGINGGKLVASGFLPGWKNVALMGKVSALTKRFPGLNLGNVLFVTDSISDADLLESAGHPYLVQWPCEEFKAFRGVYVPFRYTAEGKYRGEGVVRRHRFGEDLVVLLLAYQAFLGGLGSVPLTLGGFLLNLWILFGLFVSFHSVYEIGYYENDFKASLREARPQVNSATRSFQDYPIARMGWLCAIVFGLLALVPLAFSQASSGASDSWVLVALGGSASADSPVRLLVAGIVLWSGVLLLTRGVFFLHNRLPVTWRTSTFASLQGLKLAAFAVFFQLTILGAALVVSQIARHLSNYIVYRQSGSRQNFPRQLHRVQVFGILVILLFLVQPAAIGLGQPQLWLILGWCIWMAASERYRDRVRGRGLVVARGIWNDVGRLLRYFF